LLGVLVAEFKINNTNYGSSDISYLERIILYPLGIVFGSIVSIILGNDIRYDLSKLSLMEKTLIFQEIINQ